MLPLKSAHVRSHPAFLAPGCQLPARAHKNQLADDVPRLTECSAQIARHVCHVNAQNL